MRRGFTQGRRRSPPRWASRLMPLTGLAWLPIRPKACSTLCRLPTQCRTCSARSARPTGVKVHAIRCVEAAAMLLDPGIFVLRVRHNDTLEHLAVDTVLHEGDI